MVPQSARGRRFQYSLCRVVLMVANAIGRFRSLRPLSVLALSSRFDGRNCMRASLRIRRLSVLALSSRFDGHPCAGPARAGCIFQYSLCRVVLMVTSRSSVFPFSSSLSVLALSSRFDGLGCNFCSKFLLTLSVLALSSRFDGRLSLFSRKKKPVTFSTRSVESF